MPTSRSPPEVPAGISPPPTAPAGPKLRDSCHACASSKVKCTKEKPTCSRCAKRGTLCEYFVTKRPGRRLDNRSNERAATTANVAQALHGPTWPTTTTLCTLSGSEFLGSPAPMQQPSPGRHVSAGTPDIFPSILSSVDGSLNSGLTNLGTDFDDLFASPRAFPIPGTSNFQPIGQSQSAPRDINGHDFNHNDNHNHNHNHTGSNGTRTRNSNSSGAVPEDTISIFGETVSEHPQLSNPLPSRNTGHLSADGAHNFPGNTVSGSSCSCLARGVDLLKQLFPSDSSPCPVSSERPSDNARNRLPTIQNVVSKNKQTIEAISNMLQCSCAQDSYLLAIMSLIVFKVLDWYAAAARATPAADDNQCSPASHHSRCPSRHSERVPTELTVVGNYCVDREDSDHLPAQLVLSELHLVQWFVNRLSPLLKAYRPQNGTIDGNGGYQISALDGGTTSSFSGKMLDQFEPELRERLTTLSTEIFNTLRQDQ